MAALSPTAAPYLTELRTTRSPHLSDLLTEEIRFWRARFDWDFGPSADLVRRFVDQQALNGFALLASAGGRTRVVGYVYTVQDDGKGLIGDLYVMHEFRTPAVEGQLLGAAVRSLIEAPMVRRIETQLLLFGPADERRPLPRTECLRRFDRCFLQARLPLGLKPRELSARVSIEQWADRHQEPAAHLIARAYAGHVDGDINDQYRTPDGARRFLNNVIQFPGCGMFRRNGSYVALDRETGQLRGMVLASQIAPEAGHITQICVDPVWRGTGAGYELLRRSLGAMADAGCRSASLTVTASNRAAIELYQRVGFTKKEQFEAYVWEEFSL